MLSPHPKTDMQRASLDWRPRRSVILSAAVMMTVAALPYWDVAALRIPGFALPVPALAALVAILLFTATGHIARPSLASWWLLGLFCYYAVTGVFLAIGEGLSIFEFAKSLGLLSMYVGIFVGWIPIRRSMQSLTRMIKVFLIAGLPQLVLGTYQVAAPVLRLADCTVPAHFMVGPVAPRIASASGGMMSYLRPQAIFTEPAHYGIFLGLYVLIAWSAATDTRSALSPRARRFVATGAWWAAVLVVLTASPTAWLYLAVAIALSYCVWRVSSPKKQRSTVSPRRWLQGLGLIAGFVLVAVVLFTSLLSPADQLAIWRRIAFPMADGSFLLRVMAGVELIRVTLSTRPVFGMGLGLVQQWLSIYYPNPQFIRGALSTMPYVVDNGAAVIVASGGILGGGLFLGAAIQIVHSQVGKKKECPWTGIQLLGLRVTIFLLLTLFLGGTFLSAGFWIPLGVICKQRWNGDSMNDSSRMTKAEEHVT